VYSPGKLGIPSLLVSGIQNGTEPPPLLFSLTISFREFGSLPSRKVQSSEVDEVFTRQPRDGSIAATRKPSAILFFSVGSVKPHHLVGL
jgi:hypothetical protein